MTLTQIGKEKIARIINMESVSPVVRRRLLDMGIMEGTLVQLKRSLPFGGPCMIEAEGQWIGIRRSDADNIRVESV
jgi:ferrous iron transport protein A